jgi:multisubunit Na+/H+ antiporter MnhG subunit
VNDPILVRRARLARVASVGQRLGYLSYLVAIVVFAVGLTTGFTDAFATTLVVLLVAGSFVLAPAIVLHYAVRAAAEEERAEERAEERTTPNP